MSRTIRRKAAWDFDPSDYVRDPVHGFQHVRYSKNTPEYNKEKAKYHSDKPRYFSGVPHWYTNLVWERSFRQQTKEIIHHWSMNPDNIECLIPPFKRSIGWYYW